jgi:hypothetical protein
VEYQSKPGHAHTAWYLKAKSTFQSSDFFAYLLLKSEGNGKRVFE